MKNVSEKLGEMLSQIAMRVFTEYVAVGGTLSDGDKPISPEVVASVNGGLPALIWVAHEFYSDDYQMPFAKIEFEAAPGSYTGYVLSSIRPKDAAVVPLLMVSDFLRNEVVPAFEPGTRPVCDFSIMFENFRNWCAEHAVTAQSQVQSQDVTPRPD